MARSVWCEECGRDDDDARGRRGYVYGERDEGFALDDEALAVAADCPACAARAFAD